MTQFAAPSTDYEVVEAEPPELMGRNLASAGHLLASATAFFFLAFLFAYLYLRSLNSGHLFKPKHVDPSVGYGTAVMVLTVASAAVLWLGMVDLRAARRPQWRLKGLAALGLGVVALIVQVVEWTAVDFGPNSGGYASVFFGWTAFNVLFLAGTMFWLETLLATAYRYRKTPYPAAGEASGDPYRPGTDIANPLSLVRPGLEALSFYWAFLAGLAVLSWVVLYLL